MTPLISGLASVASLLFNASSSGAAKPSASGRGSGSSALPEPSALITLSKEAETLSGVANQSVTASSARAMGGRSALAGSGGSVSAQNFGELLTQFGATEAQKEQLTAGFDGNHDGKISQDEFMKGLGDTSGAKGSSELSQAILQLMDQGGNANGVVDGKEFAKFSMAFVAKEKRTV